MQEVGEHKRVWEYDGAFKCLDCQKSWGAMTGALPEPPSACILPPPDWVDVLKHSADLLGTAQIAVLQHFGEKADQWRALYRLRIELAQEMERLKRVLEK